jgi:hypothetical protein
MIDSQVVRETKEEREEKYIHSVITFVNKIQFPSRISIFPRKLLPCNPPQIPNIDPIPIVTISSLYR